MSSALEAPARGVGPSERGRREYARPSSSSSVVAGAGAARASDTSVSNSNRSSSRSAALLGRRQQAGLVEPGLEPLDRVALATQAARSAAGT